ncbi:hypothetical protein G6F40_015436 [Rhizopus arrhizus]|nr:hypothetical protein G6F40_015436 [Rhizopus arrhizus]
MMQVSPTPNRQVRLAELRLMLSLHAGPAASAPFQRWRACSAARHAPVQGGPAGNPVGPPAAPRIRWPRGGGCRLPAPGRPARSGAATGRGRAVRCIRPGSVARRPIADAAATGTAPGPDRRRCAPRAGSGRRW